ncbi:MAG: thioredoxin-dependent thiol peroxidase [Alphaproteobacteria bacterium]|nr:thioredoxin-dependent thiol peroxidase [Alphaproteobacteria bacterium]
MALKEGDKAPDFTLPGDDGKPLSLKKLRGKKIVLYFYPKDDTPGCTKEACGFRDSYAALKRKKVEVIGVSKDSVERHARFKEKYDLPFPLVSDEGGEAIQAYGVWKKKSLYGRSFMGIERSTFLIDEKGVLRGIWRKVKVGGHVEEVEAAIKAL